MIRWILISEHWCLCGTRELAEYIRQRRSVNRLVCVLVIAIVAALLTSCSYTTPRLLTYNGLKAQTCTTYRFIWLEETPERAEALRKALRYWDLPNDGEADILIWMTGGPGGGRAVLHHEMGGCLSAGHIEVYDGTDRSTLDEVLAHEIGHVLGWGHSESGIMQPTVWDGLL